MSELYKHQRDGVEFILANRGGFLWFDMGLGKTRIIIEAFKVWRQHGYKLLVICPLSLIETAWRDDIGKFAPELKMCNMHKPKRTPADVYVTNYEGLVSKRRFAELQTLIEQHSFICALDECFDGKTLVDMADGSTKMIMDIKVGDRIINCNGIDEVLSTRVKTLYNYVLIRYNSKVIKCSENHPFLTDRGWVSASKLKKGDNLVSTGYSKRIIKKSSEEFIDEEVSSMWRRVLACFYSLSKEGRDKKDRKNKANMLFNILFAEVKDERYSIQEKNIHKRIFNKGKQRAKELLQKRRICCGGAQKENGVLRKEQIKRNNGSNKKKITLNKMEAGESWRKWKTISDTAIEVIQTSWKWLGNRICPIFGKEDRGISDALQDRYCKSVPQNSRRGGRIFSSIKERSGQKEGYEVDFIRVESVEIHKSGGHGESGSCIKENKFYDLEIMHHPSFSVNGVLVHNSSRVSNFKAKSTKNLLSIRDRFGIRICMSGTPCSQTEFQWWPQIKFIRDGILHDSPFGFKNMYFHLERGKSTMPMAAASKDMYRELFSKGWKLAITNAKRESMMSRIRPVVLKRTWDDCEFELPPFTDEVRSVQMTDEQARCYKAMKTHMITEINDKAIVASMALTKIMKLRQITSGFSITPDETIERMPSNPKLAELKDTLDEIGDQAVIFVNFRAEAADVMSLLGDDAVLCDGSVSDKTPAIVSFTSRQKKYLVANIQSLAHGVTLTNCRYMIYYSQTYSLEDTDQSRARIRRISQTRPQVYIHLLCADSIDETIYNVLKRKGDAVEIVSEMMK